MTAHRDLKRIIRERQNKTGESYTAARVHVVRERAALLGLTGPEPMASEPLRVDAAVLKVNRQSARVRICGEIGQLTFRSQDIGTVVPGHSVTLDIEKRWTWKGDDYASGRIENPRIAIDELGLLPLPLGGGSGSAFHVRTVSKTGSIRAALAQAYGKAAPRLQDGPDRVGTIPRSRRR